MEYEWNEGKREANRIKHGVDFAAAEQFDWDSAILAEDRRRNYGEPRYIALGPIKARVHVLVFTRRGTVIRVIGLRKVNPREVGIYEEAQKA